MASERSIPHVSLPTASARTATRASTANAPHRSSEHQSRRAVAIAAVCKMSWPIDTLSSFGMAAARPQYAPAATPAHAGAEEVVHSLMITFDRAHQARGVLVRSGAASVLSPTWPAWLSLA
eukprot:CAMPEP_0171080954 /NCGR_PEP_ID=MMETSP0766_2-20121228/16202_1 /TAXON_ID=439317 /ORGANISM="Gambierdiscus australes, Strain CAWD 149" /LENGTH=120 /DNA_ID=CAMNT_0011538235 /DNA_START=270 /DNA_END=628 /DNA_ORIENTATION=+